VDLGQADLSSADLGKADLRGAILEGANLSGADLAGTRLAASALGGANFQGAMLEEADLRGASARFTNFEGAVLEHADLRRADCWGASFCGAELGEADLRKAVLQEANFRRADCSQADLRGAQLGNADLGEAKLVGADLRGSACAGARFAGAVLRRARLEGLDLSSCDVAHVHLSGAWLERTRFGRGQLGVALGEELEADHEEARKGYLTLERAFEDLGDHDAASWAYRRRRRMQKRVALEHAHAARRARDWKAVLRSYTVYASDQAVEWLCDYGESVSRVLAALLVLYLLFTVTYGVTGSVVRLVETPHGPARVVTRNGMDLAIFSLMALSTSGSPAVGLEPRDETVHLLTAVEATLGIALTGLLGFVLGNRIRR
jgi:uncharacterized protein YjbI with pentapeptide repeats